MFWGFSPPHSKSLLNRERENEGRTDQKNKWVIIRVWTKRRIRNTKNKEEQNIVLKRVQERGLRKKLRNVCLIVRCLLEIVAEQKYLLDMARISVIHRGEKMKFQHKWLNTYILYVYIMAHRLPKETGNFLVQWLCALRVLKNYGWRTI